MNATTTNRRSSESLRKLLLLCGVAASLWYMAMNIVAMGAYPGYSAADAMVSELSAIGAPSREIWVRMGYVYSALMFAFSFGVWISAGSRRALRFSGVALFLYTFIGLFWPPMHMRGAEMTITDTLHIVFTFATVTLMLLAMVIAAKSVSRGFLWYSIATIAVLSFFGFLAGQGGSEVANDLPSPMLGVWQRINMGAFFLWVIVFSAALWRPQSEQHE